MSLERNSVLSPATGFKVRITSSSDSQFGQYADFRFETDQRAAFSLRTGVQLRAGTLE
jgi:hypothetical protein